MKQKNFSNFNLFTIRYPLTAIISILHRLSGLFVFLLIPFFLWILQTVTHSQTGYDHVHAMLMKPGIKFILWLSLAAFGYHFVAGFRHLMMDIGWGESLVIARLTATLTLIISLVWAILIGIWLW
jgi:succinate dehydrogenase / fumarate reductase cytochrome b subunit